MDRRSVKDLDVEDRWSGCRSMHVSGGTFDLFKSTDYIVRI
jgi:hypothetical protein